MASYAELMHKPLASSDQLKSIFYKFASFGDVQPSSTQFFTVGSSAATSSALGSGSTSTAAYRFDEKSPIMYFYHFNKMLTEAGLYLTQYAHRTEGSTGTTFTESAARNIFNKSKKSGDARMSYEDFVNRALDAIASEMPYQTAQSVVDRIIVARHPRPFDELVAPHRLKTPGVSIDTLPAADRELERDILTLEVQALEADMKIAVSHEEQMAGNTLEHVLSQERAETTRVLSEVDALEREISALSQPSVNFSSDIMEHKDNTLHQLENTFTNDHPRELWDCVRLGQRDNIFATRFGVSRQCFDPVEDIKEQQVTMHDQQGARIYCDSKEFDHRVNELWNKHAVFARRNEEQAVALQQEKLACSENQSRTIAAFQREHLNERQKLEKLRKNLRMILTEMTYHKKRGTYIKAHDNIGKSGSLVKSKELRLERVKDIYFKTRQHIVKEEEKVKELRTVVDGLKRKRHNDTHQIEAAEREIVEEMEKTAAEQEEAHWELESLKREFEEIRKIRSEVMGMHAVMKHKLDEDILRQPNYPADISEHSQYSHQPYRSEQGGESNNKYNTYHPVRDDGLHSTHQWSAIGADE